jgi:hypothetical protein
MGDAGVSKPETADDAEELRRLRAWRTLVCDLWEELHCTGGGLDCDRSPEELRFCRLLIDEGSDPAVVNAACLPADNARLRAALAAAADALRDAESAARAALAPPPGP